MNTIRMFAFAAALLITAALFAFIADGLASEPAIDTATAAHTAAASGAPESAADRSSP
jgi:hypothetical protein